MRTLVHEIHRRSLWQVLGIYLAGSWVALQVVEQLTEAAGLPEWVRPFSLVLLILGFPVVMATAFVQEGVGLGRGTERDRSGYARGMDVGSDETGASGAGEGPADSPGDETGRSVPTPASVGAAHHRLLTWRNAILGGVGAFAVLGVLTVGYLALRALGIGPAGTLVAQGVFEEGAHVVLADFESADPDLADVVTGALRIDLLQSPTIRVVERTELADVLRRMERDPDDPVTAQIAREAATRGGYPAVIEGEIGTAGSGYVLTASIVGAPDWTSLAAFRTTARGEDDLIEAIEKLSRDIRDKAGESLRTVRSGPPLGRVTTGSLEALRLYTRADHSDMAGDEAGAADLFERAAQIDPDFAMAHRKVAVMLGNLGIRRADQVAAYRRAYELRDRLPEAERYLAEADYQDLVLGNRDAAIRAFESLLEIDPDNDAGLNNLALLYWERGRLEESEALLAHAIGGRPFFVGYLNLSRVRFDLGRAADAEAALDSGIAALPDGRAGFEDLRVVEAASAGDWARADSLAAAFETSFDTPLAERRSAVQRFALAAVRGKLREADGLTGSFDAAPGFFANPMAIANVRARLAIVADDRPEAARRLLEASDAAGGDGAQADMVYGVWLPTLIEAGAVAEAEAIYADWRSGTPEEVLGSRGRDARRAIDAALASARGRQEEAARLWEAYERECPWWCGPTAALGLARTREAAGDGSGAIAEYERYLAGAHWDRIAEDQFERGPVLERLGGLYDDEGDLENAAKYYAMFTELWADADEELQPRVRAAQERLEEILRERG